MTMTLLDVVTTRELTPRRTIVVLRQAIESQARVLLKEHVDDVEGVAGILIDGDAESLEMFLESVESLKASLLTCTELCVELNVDGRCYVFEANLMEEATTVVPPCAVRFRRPETIASLERRRTPRRNLRRPASVKLGSDQRQPIGRGLAVLLNLSQHGLACLVRRGDDHQLAVGSNIRTNFRVQESDEEFDLVGCVVNLTEAGTPGQVVVGLEFLSDPAQDEMRERLGRLLEAKQAS